MKKQAVHLDYGWFKLSLFCDCFLSHVVMIKVMHIDYIYSPSCAFHESQKLLHRLAWFAYYHELLMLIDIRHFWYWYSCESYLWILGFNMTLCINLRGLWNSLIKYTAVKINTVWMRQSDQSNEQVRKFMWKTNT